MSGGLIMSDGETQRNVMAPTPGTAADYFHRCAVEAARRCDDESRPLATLRRLTLIAVKAKTYRDLLTQRSTGRVSNNVTFSYMLVGQVDCGDCRGAMLRLAREHAESAKNLRAASIQDPRLRDHAEMAEERAHEMTVWASLTDDEPREDRVRWCALYTTLTCNLLQFIARTGPDQFQMALFLSADSMILATSSDNLIVQG